MISSQTETSGHRVHEAVARESQCHPTDRQSRHSHSRGMPTVQEAGQWFPQLHTAAGKKKKNTQHFTKDFCFHSVVIGLKAGLLEVGSYIFNIVKTCL